MHRLGELLLETKKEIGVERVGRKKLVDVLDGDAEIYWRHVVLPERDREVAVAIDFVRDVGQLRSYLREFHGELPGNGGFHQVGVYV